ncbi:DUF2946 family protein [Bradyrhizobium sp.]|uniref:DUF2946 family protein n=1 Tax=Bradyrhizobium sp. TaxID=376 RepID=UPI00345B6393
MKGWGHRGGQSAARALVARRGTKRSPLRPRPTFVASSLSRRFLSRFGAALVWFAAWALIVQTSLALCSASAAAGVLDATSPAVICHTSSDDSSNTLDSSNTVDPISKQCSKCPLCVFGRGVTMPQAPVTALPLPTAVTIAIERIDFFSPHLHGHDQPVARGPPTTA